MTSPAPALEATLSVRTATPRPPSNDTPHAIPTSAGPTPASGVPPTTPSPREGGLRAPALWGQDTEGHHREAVRPADREQTECKSENTRHQSTPLQDKTHLQLTCHPLPLFHRESVKWTKNWRDEFLNFYFQAAGFFLPTITQPTGPDPGDA